MRKQEDLTGVVRRCLSSLVGRGLSELFGLFFITGVLFVTARFAGPED
jgi:hypothetical protein